MLSKIPVAFFGRVGKEFFIVGDGNEYKGSGVGLLIG